MKEIDNALNKALNKKKISPDLAKDFSIFLEKYSDWKLQTLYLLNDKNQKVEQIIQDLYEVPIAKQATWIHKKKTGKVNKSSKDTDLEKKETFHKNRTFFVDWKQEHGFNSIVLENKTNYVFVKFKSFINKNFHQKFLWGFYNSKNGGKKWGKFNLIKDVKKELSSNIYKLGCSVKTYLQNNTLIRKQNDEFNEEDNIPNPFILDSENSHNLLHLLFGYNFLLFDNFDEKIIRHSRPLTLELKYIKLEGYNVLFCNFNFELNAEKNFDRHNSFIIGENDKALITNNNYWQLDSSLDAEAIREVIKGVFIPESEWEIFYMKFEKIYPKLKIKEANESKENIPIFNTKEATPYEFWLKTEATPIFTDKKNTAKFFVYPRAKRVNYSRIGVKVTNFNAENYHITNTKECPKTIHFFNYAKQILKKKDAQGLYQLDRVAASQFLQLAENYPYIYNNEEDFLFEKNMEVEFSNTIRKEKANQQYLLKGVLHLKLKTDPKKLVKITSKKTTPVKVIGLVPCYVLYQNKIYKVTNILNCRFIDDCLSGVLIKKIEINDFYSTVTKYLKARNIKISDPQKLLKFVSVFNYSLQGIMKIKEVKNILQAELNIIMKTDIGNFNYPLYDQKETFQKKINGESITIPKNRILESKLFDFIYEDGWVEKNLGVYFMDYKNTLNFVFNKLGNQSSNDLLIYYGAKNLTRWKVLNIAPKISINVKQRSDWFDLNVSFENQNLNLEKIIAIWKENKGYIELEKEKGWILINQNWIDRYAPIFHHLVKNNSSDKNIKTIAVNKQNIGLLEDLVTSQNIIKFKNRKLLKFSEQPIPKTVKVTLRDYQKDGVNWFCFLRKNKFGGILADDMGLGKTIQALTFLEIIRLSKENSKKAKKPHLVICPTSVVSNWIEEIEKVTPLIKYILYHGPKRKNIIKDIKNKDIIITSYALLQKDSAFFTDMKYDVILLDEAQNIKNARSKTAKIICQLNSIQRISLTGTPIENNISEFWSQFNFLMPNFLGSLKDFTNSYIKHSPQKNKEKEFDFSLIKKKTKPFILRRLKKNVAKFLPKKTEQVFYCEMKKEQRKLYDSVLLIEKKNLLKKIEGKLHPNKIKFSFFNSLLKLRQICCDPKLSKIADANIPSAKLEFFLDHVSEIVAEGHRVLVFSQFVKMLCLMHEPLKERNIPFLQLDGYTPHRKYVIDKFQKDAHYPVFLISLKAGGTGINLTAADYVIHYDPWWNPAVEAQASDRIYRIGQDKQVFIYKLITKDSVEEKILALQNKKLLITENVISNFKNISEMLDNKSIKEILY